jgi:L,D-transpeptidase YcbB
VNSFGIGCLTALVLTAPAFAQQAAAPTRVAVGAPSAAKPAPAPRALVSRSSEPTFDEGTHERISAAMFSYAAIEVRGGWPALPAESKLSVGDSGPAVAMLRRRLAITEDLPPQQAQGDAYDDALAEGVKRFQARHGLPETGAVGPQTLTELNVPVSARLRQLAASLDRLAGTSFSFGQRYVVVNIPAAYAEAVSDGQVDRRYVAVVGKTERPSPEVTGLITAVNLNPTWTAPLSIVKKDIIPKMRKDPGYAGRMGMRLIDAQGGEIDPKSVDWNSDRAPNFTVRQDSGSANALGAVRIDMPNAHAVYMHDTPSKNLFGSDYRFHSSGCARIADVRDLAAWLLEDNPGWSRREIDAAIAAGKRTDIRLTHAVRVAWVYLTGWAGRDGTVHFRKDVYGHDEPPARPHMVELPPRAMTVARASGFILQSADPEPPREFKDVSYLDSQ